MRKLVPPTFPPRLWYHRAIGFLAALLYRFPAKKMIIIGVTGTNGKTTTVNMITEILRNTNKQVGMASTVNFRIGDDEWVNETHKTTLGRFGLQKLLREMVNQGCEYAVLEISSHALSQGRLLGIPIDLACFTNLSREHLDYHGTMEAYRNAKGKLFKLLTQHKPKTIHGRRVPRVSVVNVDDPQADYFLSFQADERYVFSVIGVTAHEHVPLKQQAEMLKARDIELSSTGTRFTLEQHNFRMPIDLNLLGTFNVENALAAATVCTALNVSPEIIKHTLERFATVPGRLEEVNLGQSFKVLIDYAVTPDSFTKVFETLRPITKGKLISVFGACGDRDQGKRPMLGEIAGLMTDVVIVTNEEPYTEKPEAIIDAISSGIPQTGKKEGQNFWKIPDRSQAIDFAVQQAEAGDTIVITGMGNQTSMVVGTTQIPWSDRDVAREAIREKLETRNSKLEGNSKFEIRNSKH